MEKSLSRVPVPAISPFMSITHEVDAAFPGDMFHRQVVPRLGGRSLLRTTSPQVPEEKRFAVREYVKS